jgi:hypothetical protein
MAPLGSRKGRKQSSAHASVFSAQEPRCRYLRSAAARERGRDATAVPRRGFALELARPRPRAHAAGHALGARVRAGGDAQERHGQAAEEERVAAGGTQHALLAEPGVGRRPRVGAHHPGQALQQRLGEVSEHPCGHLSQQEEQSVCEARARSGGAGAHAAARGAPQALRRGARGRARVSAARRTRAARAARRVAPVRSARRARRHAARTAQQPKPADASQPPMPASIAMAPPRGLRARARATRSRSLERARGGMGRRARCALRPLLSLARRSCGGSSHARPQATDGAAPGGGAGGAPNGGGRGAPALRVASRLAGCPARGRAAQRLTPALRCAGPRVRAASGRRWRGGARCVRCRLAPCKPPEAMLTWRSRSTVAARFAQLAPPAGGLVPRAPRRRCIASAACARRSWLRRWR